MAGDSGFERCKLRKTRLRIIQFEVESLECVFLNEDLPLGTHSCPGRQIRPTRGTTDGVT